jgi:hypothetical protein
MSSIGLNNPISGSYTSNYGMFMYPQSRNLKSPYLGGPIKGFIPPPVQDVDNNDLYAQTRFTLTNAWNTKGANKWNTKAKTIQTPFRAVTNSGDLLCRDNYTCGGSCQTFQSRPGMFGLKQRFGAIQYLCDGTGVPPAACNVKYVYDSSNYTTYLKQKAINYNYNDYSYGGDQHSASQSAWRRSRRQ